MFCDGLSQADKCQARSDSRLETTQGSEHFEKGYLNYVLCLSYV